MARDKYYRRLGTKAGYPMIPRPFTYDEINEYLSTEKIVCLRCGNEYGLLAKHLVYVHDITVEAYKELYGLPSSRGLASPSTRKLLADGCEERTLNPNSPAHKFFHDPETREETRKVAVVASQKQIVRPFRSELARAHIKKGRQLKRRRLRQ